MQGRIEHELIIDEQILNKLADYPSYLMGWYKNLKANNQTAPTRRTFINVAIRFLKYINEDAPTTVTLDEITQEITEDFITSTQKKTVSGITTYTSDSYKQGVWCAMNNFFNYLVYHDLKDKNYMDGIKKSKNRDLERINKHRILLTEKDFNKILSAARNNPSKKFRNRDVAIILMFMTTGMRKTALTEINVDDIDFESGIFETIDKNKNQTYTLDSHVLDCLKEWVADREMIKVNTDALFVSNIGSRMTGTAIDDVIKKYCDEALGYHVSPHKLRAGFCSILFKKTGNIEYVRRAVGHSNIATTQRYIVTDDDERETASAMILGSLKM